MNSIWISLPPQLNLNARITVASVQDLRLLPPCTACRAVFFTTLNPPAHHLLCPEAEAPELLWVRLTQSTICPRQRGDKTGRRKKCRQLISGKLWRSPPIFGLPPNQVRSHCTTAVSSIPALNADLPSPSFSTAQHIVSYCIDTYRINTI